MSKIVNGASLQPRSGKAPRQIVLLLHGFGSSGDDMIALAPHWQEALPDALFLAPHAPQRCTMMAAGYQWWGLSGLAPAALAAGAAAAAPAIHAFIDRKLAQYGLSETDMAIAGFSQGTMMALHVGLRRPRAVAAVVGYSGMLTATSDLAPDFASPRFCWFMARPIRSCRSLRCRWRAARSSGWAFRLPPTSRPGSHTASIRSAWAWAAISWPRRCWARRPGAARGDACRDLATNAPRSRRGPQAR